MSKNNQYQIILDEIPKIQEGLNEGKINWNLSIGKFVYFKDKNVMISFKIIEYFSTKRS